MPHKNENVEQQISILDTSSYHVFLVALAIFLSIETLDIQRDQLTCQIDDKANCGNITDLLPLQLTSSALTLISTTYFFRLSKQIYCASSEGTANIKNKFNYVSSYLVLIASVIRILSLLITD